MLLLSEASLNRNDNGHSHFDMPWMPPRHGTLAWGHLSLNASLTPPIKLTGQMVAVHQKEDSDLP